VKSNYPFPRGDRKVVGTYLLLYLSSNTALKIPWDNKKSFNEVKSLRRAEIPVGARYIVPLKYRGITKSHSTRVRPFRRAEIPVGARYIVPLK
jgi:hypothetical protein